MRLEGESESARETAFSRDTERAAREQHSAGHNLNWPRAHEERRRVTTPCVRPTNHTHHLFIYVYLTGFLLVPSSFHCYARARAS